MNKHKKWYADPYKMYVLDEDKQPILTTCSMDEKDQSIVSIAAKAPEMLGVIKAVTDVLDTVLGDTDPEIDDDWTDEEIRDEYPIMWCMQQLTKFVNKSPEGGAE